ncbi:DUF364 domain-containing protein [Desulfogranum japonicum]|uniref:DUF364 domain-containing protein n=1 Tax=Desulfogranum japonicum TaxID=231447 RepID=UPI0003F82DA3|nr:DUF364 domain-containing protein [Desulfogranum japonicum]
MSIAAELIRFGTPLANGLTVKEIRLGLGYSCAELSDNSMGIAWTPDKNPQGTCTHFKTAGTIQGSDALTCLEWLESDNHLARAIGLAVFNALNSKVDRSLSDEEAISLLGIKPEDHVVMVGYFAPVLKRIRETGCSLDIVELNTFKPNVLNAQQGKEALARCDVAIITATTIINNTCEEVLASLKKNRAALMLGPSTPVCPEIFKDTRISQLSGAFVTEPKPLKVILSEGGGTKLLKKHLRFASAVV